MQVYVVTSTNSHLYEGELDAYFRERHRVYAEELGWVGVSPDGLEKDPYDTEHAVHLIGIEEGQVVAGSRLVPTSQPHLLGDVFPHLCTLKGVVRDPRIAEWTRGFIPKRTREANNFRIHFQFCHAVMEYALDEGIVQVGGIQRTYWLNMWARMGWKVHIIGEPEMFADGPWVPAYFDVDRAALDGAARWGKLDGSILVRQGDCRPFIETDQDVVWASKLNQHGGLIDAN